MTLLYVMSEYPSVTQTFVANEAAAVNGLGVRVLAYALKRGKAGESAASVDLICPPATWIQLLTAGARTAPAIVAGLWRARGDRLRPREMARLVLAFAHAAYVARLGQARGIAHIHAHFLGRAADVASALAPSLGCRWTVTAHAGDVYAPPEPGLLRRRLGTVAAVACANRGVQEGVARHAAPANVRTELIHCGVDTTALSFSSGGGARDPVHLVTVGRLVATKGYWTVLGAAASLMGDDATLQWTIVGDGPLREPLRRDPTYVRLSPRLNLVGALNHRAVVALLGRTTVFVLPCELGAEGESDGIPVALMEAMALGVPVVTTPIAGIPELVIQSQTGFLVAPTDAGELADTLHEILYEMPQLELDSIRRAARDKIQREFDLVSEARALIDLLSPYACPGL